MAGSVNKVILVGHLGRDPEVRHTQNNQKIVHLSVATSERWKDRQSGEPRERTEWHRVVIFNENLADDRRALPAQGQPGLPRGPAADPQVDRPGRAGALHDRGRGAALPRRAHAPGRRAREGGGTEIGSPEDFGGDTGYRSPAPGSGPSERGRPTGIAEQLDDDIPF